MADKLVDVPGIGQVSFPDTMSDEDINGVIRQQVPPSAAPPRLPRLAPPIGHGFTYQGTPPTPMLPVGHPFTWMTGDDFARYATPPAAQPPALPPLHYEPQMEPEASSFHGAQGNEPGLPPIVEQGLSQLVHHALPAFAGGGDWRTGVADTLEGGGKMLSPLLLPAAAAAPIPTLIGIGTGVGAGLAGHVGSQMMNADPETQRLITDPSGLVGGMAGGGITHLAGDWAADAIPFLWNMRKPSTAIPTLMKLWKQYTAEPEAAAAPKTAAARTPQRASIGPLQFLGRFNAPPTEPPQPVPTPQYGSSARWNPVEATEAQTPPRKPIGPLQFLRRWNTPEEEAAATPTPAKIGPLQFLGRFNPPPTEPPAPPTPRAPVPPLRPGRNFGPPATEPTPAPPPRYSVPPMKPGRNFGEPTPIQQVPQTWGAANNELQAAIQQGGVDTKMLPTIIKQQFGKPGLANLVPDQINSITDFIRINRRLPKLGEKL
jgi:hypothetical protein